MYVSMYAVMTEFGKELEKTQCKQNANKHTRSSNLIRSMK